MRFDATPPPSPNWERHLEPESQAQLATGCRETKDQLDAYARRMIEQRDTGDEHDDGLEVME